MKSRKWFAGLFFLLLPSLSAAQVDCDVPEDLCTGDPCVITTIELGESCVLDFGARHVVIRGRILMPNGGELALRAGSIEVLGAIYNRRSSEAPANGPRIALLAAGDLDYRGRIRLQGVKGALVPGEVRIEAGGILTASGNVAAFTEPTALTYRGAGGDINFTGRARMGKFGGRVTIESGGSLEFRGGLSRIDDVTIRAVGDVDLIRRLKPRKTLEVDAGGVLTLRSPLRSYGLDVVLSGDAGVLTKKAITVIPLFVFGGTIDLRSRDGSVTVLSTLHASDIDISAGGDVWINAVVTVRPPARSGGTIDITSTGGNVQLDGWLRAQSGDGTLDTDGAGGQIVINAAGRIEATQDISVNSFPQNTDAPGGSVHITAGEIALRGRRYDADGKPPGPAFAGFAKAGFRLISTSGDISLSGIFEAKGGPSLIQVTSAADLTLDGSFSVAPLGCLGLSAGGLTDWQHAEFDTASIPSCPE
jgi:hypothetical protein